MKLIAAVCSLTSSLIALILFILASFAAFTPPNYGAHDFSTTVVLILSLSYSVIGWYLVFGPTDKKATIWFVTVGCVCLILGMTLIFGTTRTTLSPAESAELFAPR
ncbi:hypothetical protein FJY94_07970 [Candidatus Kaiserbacteria bacterium]|nr:hypothetical protein [Candidatus Kaiserbacteria bacterium]